MKAPRKILAGVLALSLCMGSAATIAADYTVVKGDSLWKISQKHWEIGKRWKEIYQANKDTVKNPDRIYIGQVLHIPELSSTPVQTSAPVCMFSVPCAI